MKKLILKVATLCLLAAIFPAPKRVFAAEISSRCGILMEQITGRTLFEKCADDEMYIASITKILTALIAIENGELDEWVEVTEEVIHQVGSSLYLTLGDEIKLIDLIYGLMLRSGNDAALAIALFIGGDEATFINMMNERAREIGMENSAFQNPSGLDETTYNLSTARDMAQAMRYAMNHPLFREIAGTKNHHATSKAGRVYVWTNKHKLITGFYQPTIAGKTGFTERARRTLVTSAAKDGLELIVVTLKAGDDWNDHRQLFEYGFNNYQLLNVVEIGPLHLSGTQIKEHDLTERLYVNRSVYLAIREDESEGIKVNLMLTDEARKDEQVGTLQIFLNDEIQEEIPVYRLKDFQNANRSWFGRLFNWLTQAVMMR